ncbi:MAG: hypothetical protein EOM65_04890 [Synergistales bacterium]|nr:hypothetical protein [Synergistales bacterium]
MPDDGRPTPLRKMPRGRMMEMYGYMLNESEAGCKEYDGPNPYGMDCADGYRTFMDYKEFIDEIASDDDERERMLDDGEDFYEFVMTQ